ncbi:MAG: hypothetical protein ACYCTB_09710 [bacterium]
MERKSVARQNLTVVLISVLIDIAIFVFAGYRTAVVMGALLAVLDGIITLGIYLKAVTGDISYYKDKKIVWANKPLGIISRINGAKRTSEKGLFVWSNYPHISELPGKIIIDSNNDD